MSEMASDYTAIQKAAQERARQKASTNEDDAATALLEGQQVGVREKREAAEAEQIARIERLDSEVKAMEQEVAQLEAQIAELETKNEDTQTKMSNSNPASAEIHQKVIGVRKAEIESLKKVLKDKKIEIGATREFIDLSRPEKLNA